MWASRIQFQTGGYDLVANQAGDSLSIPTDSGSNVLGVNVDNAAYTATISCPITAAGSGSAETTVVANASGSGTITIDGGGGTVSVGAMTIEAGNLQVTGNLALTGSDGLTIANSATLSGSGTISLAAAGSGLLDQSDENSTFQGHLTGLGCLTVDTDGATLRLADAHSSFSGGVFLTAGTLKLAGVDNCLPSSTTLYFPNQVYIGGCLDMNGTNQTVAGLVEAAADPSFQAIGNSAANTLSTLTFAGGASTFAGYIKDGAGYNGAGGQVAVAVSGGSLELMRDNTYTGGTQVRGGTLTIGSDYAIGSTPGKPTALVVSNAGSSPGTLDSERTFAHRRGT